MSQSQQDLLEGQSTLEHQPLADLTAPRESEPKRGRVVLVKPLRQRSRRRRNSVAVDELKNEIREAVTAKKLRHPSGALLAKRCEVRSSLSPVPPPEPSDPPQAATNSPESPYPIDWLAIDASLTRVRQHVEIGRGLPELARLKAPFRQAARLVAALVLLILRFLTNRQSAFNIAGLTALHQLAEGIRRMHLSYNDQIQRLEKQAFLLRRELAGRDQNDKPRRTRQRRIETDEAIE